MKKKGNFKVINTEKRSVTPASSHIVKNIFNSKSVYKPLPDQNRKAMHAQEGANNKLLSTLKTMHDKLNSKDKFQKFF